MCLDYEIKMILYCVLFFYTWILTCVSAFIPFEHTLLHIQFSQLSEFRIPSHISHSRCVGIFWTGSSSNKKPYNVVYVNYTLLNSLRNWYYRSIWTISRVGKVLKMNQLWIKQFICCSKISIITPSLSQAICWFLLHHLMLHQSISSSEKIEVKLITANIKETFPIIFIVSLFVCPAHQNFKMKHCNWISIIKKFLLYTVKNQRYYYS